MSRRMLLLALLTTAGLSGCYSCQKAGYTAQKPPCGSCGQPAGPARLAPIALPPRPPGVVEGVAPSTFVPSTPPPAETPPAETIPPPPATPDRPTVPESTPPSVQLGVPVPRRTESARLPIDPSKSPPASVPKAAKAPDAEEERETPPPIDVPGYVLARPNVATGLKPFPDGISWLRDRGYKTVLHLRPPGEDNAAARRQFEKKGLKYLSLEVSSTTLTKAAYEQFVREVVATGNHPLYVYDQTGSMTGSLWYLYFRVKMNLDDDKAIAEVKRLLLKSDDDDDEHKKAWLAAQTLLGTLKP